MGSELHNFFREIDWDYSVCTDSDKKFVKLLKKRQFHAIFTARVGTVFPSRVKEFYSYTRGKKIREIDVFHIFFVKLSQSTNISSMFTENCKNYSYFAFFSEIYKNTVPDQAGG